MSGIPYRPKTHTCRNPFPATKLMISCCPSQIDDFWRERNEQGCQAADQLGRAATHRHAGASAVPRTGSTIRDGCAFS